MLGTGISKYSLKIMSSLMIDRIRCLVVMREGNNNMNLPKNNTVLIKSYCSTKASNIAVVQVVLKQIELKLSKRHE